MPPTRPLVRALASPALVRSRIRARTNSAAAPRTCRVNLPCGEDVSIGSVSDRKKAPFRLQPLDDLQQMREGARKAANAHDDQRVTLADPFQHMGQHGSRAVSA